MSAKWRRSLAWDDAFFPPALWPVKITLRLFSSIRLAVVLLTLVALYGILASVPIGMLAIIPTLVVYALTLLVPTAIIAGLPTWFAYRALANKARALRFPIVLGLGVALALLTAWQWYAQVWPRLVYDPVKHNGLRFFAEFCEQYAATTLRRLPGMEMSELEFYSWWPLRVILLLFVANMVIATVRRIEFTFKNLGVLTVHTGIVVITLGSVYYAGLKREGDTILMAGAPDAEGVPGPGVPQEVFYDNTRVALYLGEQFGWEQRMLDGVPRYNDYGLDVQAGTTLSEAMRTKKPWDVQPKRSLAVNVPPSPSLRTDPDLGVRLVGYASYAEPVEDWVRADPVPGRPVRPGSKLNPLRVIQLISSVPDSEGRVSTEPAFSFSILPSDAAHSYAENEAMAIEYAIGMDQARWRDLSEPLPPTALHSLVVDVAGVPPAQPTRIVRPVADGDEFVVAGWTIQVKRITPEPEFPIITEGYKGASSSVAVVRVTPPKDSGKKPFERWVYHRFPAIIQDLSDELNASGMPKRGPADPAIRIGLIEQDKLRVYFDEREDGTVRAIARMPDPNNVLGAKRLQVVGTLPDGRFDEVVPKIALRIADRWVNAEKFERPRPVAEAERQRSGIGTHENAMLAVELTWKSDPSWKRVVWLPFTKYFGLRMGTERQVELPSGSVLNLAFGRVQYPLPGFQIQMLDFEMIAYDHRGAPRDYQSKVRVIPKDDSFTMFEHVTKLNEPLRAPFHWDDNASWIANAARRLAAGVNPNQYKFSQAGWDASGWERTQQMVDQGLAKRPRASFTILGVGNSPGIHIIALGGVLMGLGIPWAFYVKPWLVQREKRRIQDAVKAGTYRAPAKASGA
ncbi:MAG: hypothetical protein SFY96_11470 [Planctomycetota bacterium]|nr:hypothetical protein [Planctomycetota bacterium]